MKILADFRPFVKGQMDFHARRARNPQYSTERQKIHQATADDFMALLEAIETAPPPTVKTSDPLTLLPEDIAGLPPELLAQLNISEGDKLDATIVEVINEAGGTLLLDKILIGLYKKTGEIHQRTQTISRIYRMGKRGLVHSVSGRKGVYTTLDNSNGEEVEEAELDLKQ
jgi:hypothetical protein